MGFFKKIGKTFNQNYNPFSSDFNEKKALFNVLSGGAYGLQEMSIETSGEAGSALLDSTGYQLGSGDEPEAPTSALGSDSAEQEKQKERQRAAALQKGSPGRNQSVLTSPTSGTSILGFN